MLTVTQVAAKADIALNTVRNYAKAYPDLFSEDARGLKGNRLFNDDDVEVICTLVALKASGMALDDAAERLRSQSAPSIVDVGATPLQQASTNAQEAQEGAITVQAVLSNHEAQFVQLRGEIEALRTRQATGASQFLTGIIVGILCTVLVAALWAYLAG
jgi:DNA-binding transcriptional MerR regulator